MGPRLRVVAAAIVSVGVVTLAMTRVVLAPVAAPVGEPSRQVDSNGIHQVTERDLDVLRAARPTIIGLRRWCVSQAACEC